jgi:hypothetical protein
MRKLLIQTCVVFITMTIISILVDVVIMGIVKNNNLTLQFNKWVQNFFTPYKLISSSIISIIIASIIIHKNNKKNATNGV